MEKFLKTEHHLSAEQAVSEIRQEWVKQVQEASSIGTLRHLLVEEFQQKLNFETAFSDDWVSILSYQ